MHAFRTVLRWSWRDLRSHWAKVVAIALVIAIGTGGYAGLSSTSEWRKVSYDASYRRLAMYDVRIDLAAGSTIAVGDLAAAVDDHPHAAWISGATERLIAPIQVDASTPTQTVLVRGEITGSDFAAGPAVNSYHALTGRLLTPADDGEPHVMLERTFAKVYELPDTGTIAVSGGRELEYVGQATTPEYFTVAPEGEMFMTEATFAGVFATLETAQAVAGAPGRINNLVLTLSEEADRAVFVTELEAVLTALPVGATVSTRDDNLSYAALTTDIEQDQAIFNALAVLLLAGAIGAAVNLVHRLAQEQRREIGIGMALGVRPAILAVRPLLVSAQIALLGVALGIGVGTLIGNAMSGVFREFIPLPIWNTSFQYPLFFRVAAAGVVLPFLASIFPVWRAVRVPPIDAIKPAHLATGTAARAGGRRSSRRRTLTVMPFRNLRRTPRRTILTVLGIAAAITVLVGFLGIMDSVFGAVDQAESEAQGSAPERVAVGLDGFYPIDSEPVAAIAAAESVAVAEPTLRLPASARAPGSDVAVELIIDGADLIDGMWRPTIAAGELTEGRGLIITEKAAADLGVGVGDTVTLQHPRREGLATTAIVESDVVVTATHPHPVRAFAFIDRTGADLFNLAGITNALNVLPAEGATTTDVQRELFEIGWVSSVQSVTAVTEAVRDGFDQIIGVIQVIVVAVLLLALLIAFNTAAINLDSRSREHATMFAFGVKVRTALRMAATESFIIGAIATVLGLGGGLAMVWWMTQRLLPDTLPDFALDALLSSGTIVFVSVMGIVAVAAAPLLTARRMRRMDLPGTLRLVE